jgi:orotidine-5'-phosphate decarboxylase
LNPYLGSDGIQPFLEAAQNEGRGVFVLVRTSNPSAREFQDLVCDGESLFQRVAARLRAWAEPYRGASGYSLAGAVVGATYPEELAGLRRAMPGVLFLVPGYGAQGGTARDVASAFDSRGRGAIINSSRGIIEAYLRPEMKERFGDDWQEAVSAALDHMIEDLAVHTPAGALRMGSATGSS